MAYRIGADEPGMREGIGFSSLQCEFEMDHSVCVQRMAMHDGNRQNARRVRWWQHWVAVWFVGGWLSLAGDDLQRSLRAAELPHIVVILADDMGYGDVHALNPGSRLATPHLDRLAGESLTFTDGHSPSAVCTPTRYGLLTGRYCWRTRLKRGVLGGYSRPLLPPQRATFGSLLQGCGYQTMAVGK